VVKPRDALESNGDLRGHRSFVTKKADRPFDDLCTSRQMQRVRARARPVDHALDEEVRDRIREQVNELFETSGGVDEMNRIGLFRRP